MNNITRELLKIPTNKRLFKRNQPVFDGYFCQNSCVLGMPVSFDFETIDSIPEETKGIYCYLGPEAVGIISAISDLSVFKRIENLTIGLTKGNEFKNADYSGISEVLSAHHFPRVTSFVYGIDELLANEHCLYGNLGDITGILENMPNLIVQNDLNL